MGNNPKQFEKMKNEILSRFNTEVDKLADRIAIILNDETKEVIGEKIIVSGNLRESISSEVRKKSWEYMIRIFSNAPYARFVNGGTKPHYPPIEPIIQWVKKKGLSNNYSSGFGKKFSLRNPHAKLTNNQNNQERIIAGKIAWKISKKGTRGIKFFEIALKQALPKIEAEVKSLSIAIVNN